MSEENKNIEKIGEEKKHDDKNKDGKKHFMTQ
jgi:hypothetical protein